MGQGRDLSSNILQTVGTGYVSMGAFYPTTARLPVFQLIAQIINANVGARILYATYGGFDNHAAEDQAHDQLVQNVSDIIKAFFDDLDGHGKAHDVLLMTWSEFGRRVQDNASNGTDHGTSAPHFVVGDAVASDPRQPAGLWPSRRQRQSSGRERLPRATDGLSDWLGAEFRRDLGAGWPNLGFLNKSSYA